MKIQIKYDNEDSVEGFEVVDVKYGVTSLDGIVDHSSEEIYISNSIDRLNHEDVHNLLVLAVKKLRLNGEIFVNGTDLNSCCLSFLNGNSSVLEMNELIERSSSLHSLRDIEEIFRSLGLTIQTSILKGMIYEIRARRIHG
jgi:hypothetical protein